MGEGKNMEELELEPLEPRKGIGILRDPIHNYIAYTRSASGDETTEQELLTHRWVQRLRRIKQLQGAWASYPAADHSRLQHSIGVMHLAGKFAKTIYAPFYKQLHGHRWMRGVASLPSINYIIEIARIAGLLHDIGHGPFSHLLDQHYLLPKFGITHEDIAIEIIKRTDIGEIIQKIRRSPYGELEVGEQIKVEDIFYLIKSKEDDRPEYWWRAIRRILQGLYNADTMDYLMRDAHFSGLRECVIDAQRLIKDSFIALGQKKGQAGSSQGLALHINSLPALEGFINTRFKMFEVLYWHKRSHLFDALAGRRLEESIRKLKFITTSPKADWKKFLDDYYYLDECSFIARILENKELRDFWESLYSGSHGWQEAYYYKVAPKDLDPFFDISTQNIKQDIQKRLRDSLAKLGKKNLNFDKEVIVDIRSPLQVHPSLMDFKGWESQKVLIYDDATGLATDRELKSLLKGIPEIFIPFRIFTNRPDKIPIIRKAAEDLWGRSQESTY
jgi:HD superfamily phosphohydrolase